VWDPANKSLKRTGAKKEGHYRFQGEKRGGFPTGGEKKRLPRSLKSTGEWRIGRGQKLFSTCRLDSKEKKERKKRKSLRPKVQALRETKKQTPFAAKVREGGKG